MKHVLVTGANRGIGLELCRQLSERGDEVIAVVRRSSPELEQLGCRVESGIDVTHPEDLARLQARLGDLTLDLVISNAGILSNQSLGKIDAAAIEQIMDQFRVNALGPVLLAQALRSRLAKGSTLAIITSRMGSIADNTSGGSYGYRMSKSAVNSAGVSLARDLAGDDVCVLLLHPGYVRTDMTGHSGLIDSDESARGLIERIDQLGMEASGGFYHANGEKLPW
ncbi:MAG: SDR family oxidoreductase [Chromatiales bacterium]|nr:SDR family oxidoreductase [Chromatiales bacterium]